MVRVLTLPELLLRQPRWHHTSYRGIHQFHRMQRWDTLAQALQRSVNLQEAARIGRGDDIGMSTQDMLSLALAQLVGRLWLDQVVDTIPALPQQMSASGMSTTSIPGMLRSTLRGCRRTRCAWARWQASW